CISRPARYTARTPLKTDAGYSSSGRNARRKSLLISATSPSRPKGQPSGNHEAGVARPMPAPPRSPALTGDFPWFDEYPRFRGRAGRLAVSPGKKDRFRGSSGPSVSDGQKTVSRGACKGAARHDGRRRVTFQLAVTTAATRALALTPFGQAIYVTPLTWILMLAPLGQVFFISFRINNLSASTAWTLFLAASPTDANRTSSPCAPRAPMSAKAARTPLPIGADEVTALDRTAAYAKGPACRTFTGISLTICSGYPVL